MFFLIELKQRDTVWGLQRAGGSKENNRVCVGVCVCVYEAGADTGLPRLHQILLQILPISTHV